MTEMFWPVVIFRAISLAIGLYTYTQVRRSSKNYTVCNKAMPFIVIGTALMAQAVASAFIDAKARAYRANPAAMMLPSDVPGDPLPYGWTPQQQYLDTGLGYQAAPRQGTGNGAVIPKNVAEEAALREGGKQSEAVPAQVVQDYLKPNGVKEQDDATLNSISSIHEARRMLEKGIQTGALADKLQSLRSIGDALGFEVDDRVLTDTQTYQNFIRQTVIPKMKELGGNDSNEELRKMEMLSGADIKQQDATIWR